MISKRPLRIKRLLVGVAAIAALSGVAKGVKHITEKPSRPTAKYRVAENPEPKPRRTFESKLPAEEFAMTPPQILETLHHYIIKSAREAGLDPSLALTVFQQRGFDLKNPLGTYNISKLIEETKFKSSSEQVANNPFLAVDLGIAFFKYLEGRYRTKDSAKLLSYYLNGSNAQKFSAKTALQRAKKYYITDFKRFKKARELEYYLSALRFDLNSYPKKDFRTLNKEAQKAEIVGFVKHLAPKLELDVNIVLNLIFTESTFDYKAVNSRTGAAGLMQLMPITLVELQRLTGGLEKVFGQDVSFVDIKRNPYLNMAVGMLHFKYLLLRLGNYKDAIKAYKKGLYRHLSDMKSIPVARVQKNHKR